MRQAEQAYMQAVNRLTAKAVNVRSEAREAYQRYRSTYDIARHYQREVLPLRKIISDETLLRYNAMQIDVFALLTEARAAHRIHDRGDRGASAISGSPTVDLQAPPSSAAAWRAARRDDSHRQ